MSKSPEWLDGFNAASRSVIATANWLAYLGDAMRTTGNTKVADDLESCAANLVDAHELIDQATGEVIREMVASTRQSMLNMVSAALAVASTQMEDSNEAQE